jgi:hypothetical protein
MDKKYLVSVSAIEGIIVEAEAYWVNAEGELEFSVPDEEGEHLIVATFKTWCYVGELDRLSSNGDEDE